MPDPFSVAHDEDKAGLLAEERPGDNAAPMSVGELSGRLKRVVEGEFSHVRLRGEISGYKRAASGHAYLALKDESAVIDAVMWRGTAGGVAFTPADGIEVVVTGRLTTYPGRSKYQIVIERMELAGEGALMALLERRRAALAAEGLFDRDRKKALPFMPRVIGVVTSPTGWRIAARPTSSSGRSRCRATARRKKSPPPCAVSMRWTPMVRSRAPIW
jgi:exodeoxyribonuclease VII large subunit